MRLYCTLTALLLWLPAVHSQGYGQDGFRTVQPEVSFTSQSLPDEGSFFEPSDVQNADPFRDEPVFAPEPAQGNPLRWRPVAPKTYRLPGEFEHQSALVLGCKELVDQMPELLGDIVAETHRRAALILLVNDAAEYRSAREILEKRGVPLANVRFIEVQHDTMWCRDYGPFLVQADNKEIAIIDASYAQDVRPQDDAVPVELGRRLRVPTISTSLRLEGGNLLSNGRGLCITTTRLLEANYDVDEQLIHDTCQRLYGGDQMVFLEPLEGEPTGHVDMFATFPSPYTVVVGSCDPDIDPLNAEILDRNAERLSWIETDRGRLRVVRVPMPPHDDEIWRTYTNVVYVNGVLLVPIYPLVDFPGQQQALAVFSQLLPGWRVVGIDAHQVVECGGAMHCTTMNLGPLPHLPDFGKPREITGKPVILQTARRHRLAFSG